MSILKNDELINDLVESLVIYHDQKINELLKKVSDLEGQVSVLEGYKTNVLYDLHRNYSENIFKVSKLMLINLLVKRVLRGLRRRFLYPIQWLDYRYLKSSEAFQEDWYLAHNQDVLRANIDPIFHYVMYGASEGRSPIDLNKYDLTIKSNANTLFHRNPFVMALKAVNNQLPPAGSGEECSEKDLLISNLPLDKKRECILGFWYGLNRVTDKKLFNQDGIIQVSDSTYELQTNFMNEKYSIVDNGLQKDKFIKSVLDSKFFIDTRLYEFKEKHLSLSGAIPTYSIVTSFYKHIEYFKECIHSILKLKKKVNDNNKDAQRIEWIILNDDPSIDGDELLSLIPLELRQITTIFSDGSNLGIATRLNQGIERSRNEWILFLDCDDLVEPGCIEILDHYIQNFPRARYISSCCIDVDDQNRELRKRVRKGGVENLFNQGMIAGHLVAIRRDLFGDLGKFNPRYSGCHDYDLALRVAKVEPILFIPDHLYRYRWHKKTQSISNQSHQENTAFLVLINFLFDAIDYSASNKLINNGTNLESHQGICFIRTQGKRNDLLQQAVESVLDQAVPITPCIIFHGDRVSFEKFCNWGKRFGNRVELLHAPNVDLERGYPFNVGIDFLRINSNRFDFFCILDDDDIYYKIFSERMYEELLMTNSDIVYCLANSRIPGGDISFQHEGLPPSCLVLMNFIPTNAVLFKTKFLLDNLIHFRDDFRYLEDWEFLQSFLLAGAKFSFIPEALSEYRIIGDGSTDIKDQPILYERAVKLVTARGALIAKSLGINYFYRDLLEFGFGRINNLTPNAKKNVIAVYKLFKLMSYSSNRVIQ